MNISKEQNKYIEEKYSRKIKGLNDVVYTSPEQQAFQSMFYNL